MFKEEKHPYEREGKREKERTQGLPFVRSFPPSFKSNTHKHINAQDKENCYMIFFADYTSEVASWKLYYWFN